VLPYFLECENRRCWFSTWVLVKTGVVTIRIGVVVTVEGRGMYVDSSIASTSQKNHPHPHLEAIDL